MKLKAVTLKSRNYWAAAAACLFCSAFPLPAAIDTFLVIPGIPGESADSQFPNSIELNTFSESIANSLAVVSTGVVSNKATVGTITCTKPLDKASPPLYLACAQGAQLQNPVVFYFRTAAVAGNTNIFYSVTLSNVWVQSVQSGLSGGTTSETLALTCGQIQWSYSAENANGTYAAPIVHSWNVQTGTGK